ncbi:MAG: hypothetical protein DRQ89_13605 [Epsilonproteobacteria bacterium]|nr:MAG: hypothetical protein DRQ89_13605 [Campylobacterota bacterium]
MQCSNVYDIESIYITTSPCEHCIKMLMNTSAKNIYFTDLYPNALVVKDLWLNSNEYRGWYETP